MRSALPKDLQSFVAEHLVVEKDASHSHNLDGPRAVGIPVAGMSAVDLMVAVLVEEEGGHNQEECMVAKLVDVVLDCRHVYFEEKKFGLGEVILVGTDTC